MRGHPVSREDKNAEDNLPDSLEGFSDPQNDPFGVAVSLESDSIESCNLDAVRIRTLIKETGMLDKPNGYVGRSPLGYRIDKVDEVGQPFLADFQKGVFGINFAHIDHPESFHRVFSVFAWAQEPKRRTEEVHKKFGRTALRTLPHDKAELDQLPVNIGVKAHLNNKTVTIPLVTSQKNEAGCQIVYPSGKPFEQNFQDRATFLYELASNLIELNDSEAKVNSELGYGTYDPEDLSLVSSPEGREQINERFRLGVNFLKIVQGGLDPDVPGYSPFMSYVSRTAGEYDLSESFLPANEEQRRLNKLVDEKLLNVDEEGLERVRQVFLPKDTKKERPREMRGIFSQREDGGFNYHEGLSGEYSAGDLPRYSLFRVDIDPFGRVALTKSLSKNQSRVLTDEEHHLAMLIIEGE